MNPFDAVLVIAFGGPGGPADVRPFLANVLRGRRVTAERIEEVAHHYELFGGISPLTELTRAQAAGLEQRLQATERPLPVYVGMRNWHPFLADTLAEMSRAGVRRTIGLVAAPHRSYSSCTQYRENVRDARAALRAAGLADVEIVYVEDWHVHPGLIAAAADHCIAALGALAPELGAEARLIFTAHSIPTAMADRYPYRQQFEASAALVAAAVSTHTGRSQPHATVYQSRSGRPEDPWLEPDVCDYLRQERRAGLQAAVLCPLGFVSDHIEVLYDLDTEAAAVCREIGLPMIRAKSANDHPAFLDMLADVVARLEQRYRGARPLPIVPDRDREVGDARPAQP